MSANSITVKHNKHRIHPCPNDKKLSLLNLLIANNTKSKILVVTANSPELLKESVNCENVTIMDDKELLGSKDVTCELLISYDLPIAAIVYMSRLARATDAALILLDSSEQKQLYPIETLLGRVIKQDLVEGFAYEESTKMVVAQKPVERPKREYAFKTDPEDKPKYDKKPFDKKSFDKPKYDKKPFDKPKFDKPKRDGDSGDKAKKWEKKDKQPNKFLGKDENGKSIFSGKSGDRNHRHDGSKRESYDAPKKVGRKINIKARKPKEAPEE
ncbi:hypothetical protein [Candidatus Sulfurimonas baltica]|uniref:Uncharacterized protein n=1 Tax=Candidatus Sulfurimonas baltica TaxID=2740404 RepID=A0A7S7LX12_9BACT|nr:hypothetical protein [Candidatus Sulfurimonas baltica]QOY52144.1 hypothetical protein HUE88_00135 [Candidatus Sulfurimonas baltica]